MGNIAETREKIQELREQRGALISEKDFNVNFALLMAEQGIEEQDIQALDIQDHRLRGIWLKKADYAGKLRRKAARQEAAVKLARQQYEEGTWKGIGRPDEATIRRNVSLAFCRSDYIMLENPMYLADGVIRRFK